MTETLVSRAWIRATLIAGVAMLLGVLAARHPSYALAIAAVIIVTLLAFLAPVTHMAILLALTAIVPYSVADAYHVGGGGTGNSGLQISDLFLLTGFLRAALILPRLRLSRRQLTTVALVAIACAFTLFEAWQGLRAHQPLSEVGAEFRALAGGFAFALIVMTALADRGAHPRVIRALAVLGLAVGLFGIAQWFAGASFSGDFGVRSGVSLTSEGVGQLQGGLFAFPVVVVLCVAALASGAIKNGRARLFLVGVLVLNVISLLLTFERTAWVATIAAILLVGLRLRPGRRVRLALIFAVCFIVGVSTLAAVSPSTLQTAEQRLLSIGQYKTDPSVRYRSVESGFVLAKIRAKPLLGWGLADTIYWGQPWNDVPPSAESYTHVGYLWLAWHEGILGAAVLILLLALSAAWPGRARGGSMVDAVRNGAQASLVALLIMNLTFPVFHQGSQATYTMGFLVAYCALPVVARRVRAPARDPALVETALAV
ncbi:MAG TPA: O-antigen ligase family protein [Solirubrobacteraceae bacterium]|jgi:O-antigen ligase|nr:O-antigen ligase family protein [Solirubrobacteraceae bacterium]